MSLGLTYSLLNRNKIKNPKPNQTNIRQGEKKRKERTKWKPEICCVLLHWICEIPSALKESRICTCHCNVNTNTPEGNSLPFFCSSVLTVLSLCANKKNVKQNSNR